MHPWTGRFALLGMAAALLAVPTAAPAPPDPCHGTAYAVPGEPVSCLHADEPPPGVDVLRPVPTAEVRARKGSAAAAVRAAQAAGAPTPSSVAAGATVACDGDGTSGYRVQAAYVVSADKPNRYASVAGSIAQWAAGVDDVVNRSAALTGGVRRVRYVTAPVGDGTCTPTVLNLTVPAGANASFGGTINALRDLGHWSASRKYLLWVDASVLCGIAQVYPNSTDGQGNVNNGSYPQVARIDTGCWGFGQSVEAHELVHTLGAVMPDAPHHSAAGHCTDESDRMCYSDGAGVSMRQVCASSHEALLDCGGDDYFSTFPVAGSWLDTHWNAADSRFLVGGGDGASGGSLGVPTALGVVVDVNNPAVPGLPTQVTASPQLPDGRTATVAWKSARADCVFSDPTSLQSDVTCSASSLAATTVTVVATDSTGATATARSGLSFSSEVRAVEAALAVGGRSGATYTGCTGGDAYLTATVRDAVTDAPLKGVKVSFLRRVGTTTTVVGSGVSAVDGTVKGPRQVPTAGSAYSARTTATPTLPVATTSETTVATTPSCPTALDLDVPDDEVGYGLPVPVTGRLTKTSGGVTDGAAAEVVTVRLRPTGSTSWTTLGTAVTAPDGSWSARVVPKASGVLQAFLPASPAYVPASSAAVPVTVDSWQPAVVLTTTDPVDVASGGRVPLAGTATRTADGATGPAPSLKVTLQQVAADGVVSTLGTALTTASGTWTTSVVPTRTGALRAVVTGVAGHLGATSDDSRDVTVALGLALSPSTTTPLAGTGLTWTVKAAPARTATVLLQQQLPDGSWTDAATVPVVAGTGRVSLVAPTGTSTYRARFTGDATNTASVSAPRVLRAA